jgi:hypothetical protein
MSDEVKRKTAQQFDGPSVIRFAAGFLFETAERFCFVVVDIKDSQQLCDHEQILHLLSQVEQLQLAAATVDGSVIRDQLANAARIDVLNAFQVQQNFGTATRS